VVADVWRNDSTGYGNVVRIQHNDGLFSFYAHLNSWSVVAGQTVQAGQVVGQIGNTGPPGSNYGVHLHFGARVGLSTNPDGSYVPLDTGTSVPVLSIPGTWWYWWYDIGCYEPPPGPVESRSWCPEVGGVRYHGAAEYPAKAQRPSWSQTDANGNLLVANVASYGAPTIDPRNPPIALYSTRLSNRQVALHIGTNCDPSIQTWCYHDFGSGIAAYDFAANKWSDMQLYGVADQTKPFVFTKRQITDWIVIYQINDVCWEGIPCSASGGEWSSVAVSWSAANKPYAALWNVESNNQEGTLDYFNEGWDQWDVRIYNFSTQAWEPFYAGRAMMIDRGTLGAHVGRKITKSECFSVSGYNTARRRWSDPSEICNY
jgi:hypothetical protein